MRGPGVLRALSVLSAPRAVAVLAVLSALSAPRVVAVLAALSALSAPRAAGAGASDATSDRCSLLYAPPGEYCKQLEKKLGEVAMGVPLSAALQLAGGGAAAGAAHALLQAALVYGLGVRPEDVALAPRAPADLCAFLTYSRNYSATWRSSSTKGQLPLTLNVASSWRVKPCEPDEPERDCGRSSYTGVGGVYMDVHAGRAPAARRLLARRAPAAAAACRAWPELRSPDCRFLAPRHARLPGELEKPTSDWPNCTCSSNDTDCIAVLVAVDAGGGEDAATAQLAAELCARARALSPAPPLRLAALPDAALRRALRHHDGSFLFLDYDWWTDAPAAAAERVQLAPPLPCAGLAPVCAPLDAAVPVLVAPVKLIKYRVPKALGVLDKFRPAPATLRRVLRNEPDLGLERAACEAALCVYEDVRDWIRCPESEVVVYVQTCGESNVYKNISKIVTENWNRTGTVNMTLHLAKEVNCSDVGEPYAVFEKMAQDWMVARLAGAVVLGAGGAGPLPAALRARHVPLLLAGAPGGGGGGGGGGVHLPAGACAVSPDAARLLGALRWLLARCDWRRVAVLRDEGRGPKWENFSASIGNGSALVVHEQVLGPGGAQPALAALRARDARVVLLDADGPAAARVLAAAARAGMAPRAGYAWLVLRAAAEPDRPDWRPPARALAPGFEYVTLSGWWRGGDDSAPAPGGDPALRLALDQEYGPLWPPLVAPLVDALLMMMTGIDNLLTQHPKLRNDRTEYSSSLLLELLKNTSVVGVAQEQSCGRAPAVFVHRWSAAGGRLLATWRGPADAAPAALCEPGVRDAARCYSLRSGDAYAPLCHDVAIIVALCALVLAPPALCAAVSARRARLRRRDRAVEQRMLARAGRSHAAAAVLAEHAVPRAALELMDELGAGHYGSVQLAVLRAPDRAPLAVAAKTPRADAAAEAGEELLREAALLATLRHEHVVRLAGVCLEGAPLVLLEHAFHGDLRRYLRARRPLLERARAGEREPEAAHVGAAALTRLAREAAAALAYLALHRLVHRDVRAANCLVDARRALKLADFGLARRLSAAGEARGAGAGEYLCRRRALLPVLCMAPESLVHGTFSPPSDVWGLGVLMLELATLGARPFGEWPALLALRHVRAGGAPPLPRDTAAATRGVLAMCWRRAAGERPTAAQLVAYLAEHPRALLPALAPLAAAAPAPAPAASAPDAPELDSYIEEWTT